MERWIDHHIPFIGCAYDIYLNGVQDADMMIDSIPKLPQTAEELFYS